MVFSIEREKAYDKIQHSFMMKTINKLGIKGNFINLRKSLSRAWVSQRQQYHQGEVP